MSDEVPDAWVKLPTEEQMRALIPENAKFPYDFGFLPGMMRLVMAHGRIGAGVRAALRADHVLAGRQAGRALSARWSRR